MAFARDGITVKLYLTGYTHAVPSDLAHLMLTRLRLRHVRQLSAVGRLRSVSRAAEALHVSQPALSKSIHEVETTLGVRLFERTPRGLVPTAAGERLLQHCRAVESELRKAGDDIQAHLSGASGQVAVGAYLVALPSLIPKALARLMREGGDTTVRIVDGGARQLVGALLSGDVDFIVGRLPDTPASEQLVHEVLYQEPIRVICGARHPLARRRKLGYADLAQWPWVLPAPDSAAYVPITDLFLREGLPKPRMVAESTSFLMIRALLEDQPVLAAMPEQVIARDVALGLIRVLPIALPYAPLPVAITRHALREPGPAALRFMACLRESARGANQAAAASAGSRGSSREGSGRAGSRTASRTVPTA